MKLIKLFSTLSLARLSIVAIFVTAGYYFLYYDDGAKIEERLKAVESQLNDEKTKRTEIEKKMKKEEEMRGNVMQLAANLELVKTKIPNEFNQIEILNIVNRVSLSSGVKIAGLKPVAAKTTDKKLVTGAELIEEVNFDIEMSGSFIAIVNFVESLSKETKIIKIRNFILEKQSTDLTQETIIKFAGEIVGYRQTSVAKAAAGVTSTPATAPKAGEPSQ